MTTLHIEAALNSAKAYTVCATFDGSDVGAAIATLEIALQVARNNAPIYLRGGDIEMFKLCMAHMQEFEAGLNALRLREVGVFDSADVSPIERLSIIKQVLACKASLQAESEPLKKIATLKEMMELRVRLGSTQAAPEIETIDDAKAYFNAQLKGKVVKTAAGDVHIIGSTWQEFKRGMSFDAIKAKAIVHTIEVLESGIYEGKTPNSKPNKPNAVAYHFFSKKDLMIDDKLVSVGVTVEELKDGMLSFNLKAYGLGHSEHPHWQKKMGAFKISGKQPELDAPKGNDESVTLDSTVPENDDDVNFVILGVWDKDGNPVIN